MWIASAAEIRDLDRRAIVEFGIPSMVLMERAGLAVFESVRELLPDGGRVTVMCGKGNNGGDGLVVARLLHEHRYLVDCLVAAREDELTEEAKTQLAVTRAQGIQPMFVDDARWIRKADCLGCRDLIVDAVLGTGAYGDLKGPVLEAIRIMNRAGVPVVAVDVPSGICTDTGEDLGESVWALRTVTFGLPKPFLFQGIGLEHAGYWSVADIGYPGQLTEEPTDARLIDQAWVANLLPERLRASHKGDNGQVLIVAGSRRYPGAACLAAMAALRAGAGLVTVAAIPSVCEIVAGHVPEAIFLPLPEVDGVIAPSAAPLLLEARDRTHAALFGPGLTHDEPVRDLLGTVWANWDTPCVVDADALNAASVGVPLPEIECVLTPHPGEMSRLLHSSIAEVQADRFRAVHQAVEEVGKTVLLKGPYSIVGETMQPLAVNCTGNPGMASAGMGDVLAGTIATLLAQELPTYCAASCGAYWHGLAGDLCAEEIAPIGFLSRDVANALPKARAKLMASCCTNLREL
ncbi:MAG TPA: NAD(P)H-hydrate dehydratase [Fimbriimonadaceae bacterium]|nr:NAD(P)H-hydrate dehydratase [Fimbriimonadaceae bacterium]